jgi:hypothetical protein
VPDRLLRFAQALSRRGFKGDDIKRRLDANLIRTFRGVVG